MEYTIIFIFHEGKWFVAKSTVLENVVKMETRIEPQYKQSVIILQQKK